MINIAEKLKRYKGTLYSTVHGEVEFNHIGDKDEICCRIFNGAIIAFYPDGRWIKDKGECILFPSKDQRDWNKFVVKRKPGDICVSNCGAIYMYYYENRSGFEYAYCYMLKYGEFYAGQAMNFKFLRYATLEEIKDFVNEMAKHNCHFINNEFITTYVRPESRVLARQDENDHWSSYFFLRKDGSDFICIDCLFIQHRFKQCIPYNSHTSHLQSSKNTPDKIYTTW